MSGMRLALVRWMLGLMEDRQLVNAKYQILSLAAKGLD